MSVHAFGTCKRMLLRSANSRFLNVFGRKIRQNSPLRSGIHSASSEVMHRPAHIAHSGREAGFPQPPRDNRNQPEPMRTVHQFFFFLSWAYPSVEHFERILRALFISQCPYKFSSFLDLRNASNRFRLFSREFRLFLFFFPGSACFSLLASPRNLPSWVKYDGKFQSFGKEFRWTKFIAVERVTPSTQSNWFPNMICFFYV